MTTVGLWYIALDNVFRLGRAGRPRPAANLAERSCFTKKQFRASGQYKNQAKRYIAPSSRAQSRPRRERIRMRVNGTLLKTRVSGQIKAHIARKGAPTAGWWGIVMLLYELPIHFNNPTVSRLTSFELETTPSSQHSCFAALAKNSHLWTVFTVLRTAASRPLHKGGKIMTAIAGLPFRKIREFCKPARRLLRFAQTRGGWRIYLV